MDSLRYRLTNICSSSFLMNLADLFIEQVSQLSPSHYRDADCVPNVDIGSF